MRSLTPSLPVPKGFTFLAPLAILLALSFASLASIGHARLWEAFTYPSYGGLMLLLTVTGGFSLWLSNRWSRHPHTNALLSLLLATILPFILLAALFYVAGWGYSRAFYSYFFVFLGSLNFFYHLRLMRRPMRICATSCEVEKILSKLGDRKVLVVPINEANNCEVVVANLRDEFGLLPPQMLSQLSAHGIEVVDVTTFLERLTGKVDLNHLSDEADKLLRPKDYIGLKRVWETAVVIFTAPIWLLLGSIVAIAIRLDSRGPIFYRQSRVGLFGEEFQMYKFRSMYVQSELEKPKFAAENDPRVTRVGRFIRKYRLDEIPQLWNVVKGDMSLIGPRPEQVQFVREYSQTIPLYETRHFVRPGITGWAQVVHGYTDNTKGAMEKLSYDLYYVKNFSLWLDLLVIIKTLAVILRGFGSR